MELTADMRVCLDEAVLCWVATADANGQPNVSPKEVFAVDGDAILVAHIASPKTIRNIQGNPRVMVSVVDVFVQRGWQFTGEASLVWAESEAFPTVVKPLEAMTQGLFPIKAVMVIAATKAERVVAPSNWLFPDEPETAVRQRVLERYRVRDR